MKGYVYILKDKINKFYIGSTSDIKRRLQQHSAGHTQTTRNMIHPILVLSQEYETLSIARKIEKKIKNLKRKDYIIKMVADGCIKMKA
ncbi:MAG: GIY-YIG nuclease family protein [Patescibacteria group bacterium]|nr:GIY-YIG nuclease family protein [Patescibacteria group bacterium]MDD5164547.1 GIY-YIG nuclease family protein [Patescibacteria group bacterium]MDD5534328.1 GIY-YIG nuclease family protein [Patescibacteria group bacterium]